MLKKLILLLLLLLPKVSMSQLAVGDWKMYNNFYCVTKVIDTETLVYYLSSGNLFSYDKNNQETQGYTSRVDLNDDGINNIFRNYEQNYLLIAYGNGNIDIMYDDGRVVNIPDIKDANLANSKIINDVVFKGNVIYLATGFGLVKINENNYSVIESGIFNKEVSAITIVGDKLVICHENTLYYSPLSQKHNLLSNFVRIGYVSATDMVGISDNKAITTNVSGKTSLVTFDFNNAKIETSDLNINKCYYIQPSKDSYAVSNGVSIALINTDGKVVLKKNFPKELLRGDNNFNQPGNTFGLRVSLFDGLNSIWGGNIAGIVNFKLESSGTTDNDVSMTILSDFSIPSYTTSVENEIYYFVPDNEGNIYMSNRSVSHAMGLVNHLKQMNVNMLLPNGDIKDVSPDVALTASNNESSPKGMVWRGFNPVPDPNDSGAYYIGSWWEGVYKIKDHAEVIKYDWNNSPFTLNYLCMVSAVVLDDNGNLWALDSKKLCVLPADKRDNKSVVPSDWIQIDAVKGTWDSGMIALKHSRNRNMVVVSEGWDDNRLCFYDANGSITNKNDDKYRVWTSFVDQDGKIFSNEYIHCITEDANGKLWVGTSNGIIAMDPIEMLDSDARIERVKVPRNDGTNYADYLLESQAVTSISIDSSNRKWISTRSSGVYLVSEDGKEILENFNVDNSYLPSNNVYSVLCNPNGNSVFMGTDYGLIEYSGDSSPAESDYSDVYAYPNPVRPEFTGLITIKGLMNDSLVKIADAAGNVFYQARSEGGMVTWDGCNSSGERVKTGVYYVFASQNEDGNSGAVTKILVVN